MTREQAREILSNCGKRFLASVWRIEAGDVTVRLNGTFTIEELRAMIVLAAPETDSAGEGAA